SNADAALAIGWLTEAIESVEAVPVLHCCASDVPFDLLSQTKMRALSLDLDQISTTALDDVGEWIDSGRELWLGIVSGIDPPTPLAATQLTRRLLAWWSTLGYSEVDTLPANTLTPSCGLAGASPA